MRLFLFCRSMIIGMLVVTACSGWADEEQKLIAVLQSDANVVEKCEACVQLRICGTGESIGPLAAVLNDERIGHAARYALEGMVYPEASAALREAIGKTSGNVKIGLIDSAGWRHDTKAIPLLAALLSDTDITIASTVAVALGRIGGQEAVAALVVASKSSSSDIRDAASQALLRCAEACLEAQDNSDAATIYKHVVMSDVNSVIRNAAWRGQILSDGEQRPELIINALRGSDVSVQRVALKLIREIKDLQLLRSCLKQWNLLPVEAQISVLNAYVQYGNEAFDALRIASQSPHVNVRIAAWQAMVDVNDKSLIPQLIKATSSGEPLEQEAARRALTRVHGNGVDQALLACLDKADTAQKAEILLAMGKRKQITAVPVLLKHANVSEQSLRLAALESLRSLAVPDTLQPLLELIVTTNFDSDRKAVLGALYAVCRVYPEKNEMESLIIATLNLLPDDQDIYILPLLSELATPKALAELLKASQSSQINTAKEAIRVLGQWPNAAPADTLFDLAGTSTNPHLSIILLRAGIATASRAADASTRLILLQKALLQVNRAEEKKKALSHLRQIPKVEALDLAMRYLDDPDVTNEAALAAIGIADQLVYIFPDKVNDAMIRILTLSLTHSVKEAAERVLEKHKNQISFLVTWQISAPYTVKNNDLKNLFETRFSPESRQGQELSWETIPGGTSLEHPYMIDIRNRFPFDNCAAYCRTKVWSDSNRPVRVAVGSDDGFKFWVNQKLCGQNHAARGYTPDVDVFEAELQQGWNLVMIKITQLNSGWEFSIKMTNADGSQIEGVKTSLDITEDDLPEKFDESIGQQGCLVDVQGQLLFEKIRISDVTYEAASVFDVDKDGNKDIVSGEYWFAGPAFTHKHKMCTLQRNGDYYDDFCDYPMDVNGDGYLDVVTGSWFNKTLRWRENPHGRTIEWEIHKIDECGNIETIRCWDVDGDGHVEIIPNLPGESLRFYTLQRDNNGTPAAIFKKTTIYDNPQGHGLGFGDINGDGRGDFVISSGWLEAPEKPYEQKWTFHQEFNLEMPSVPILVYDVDEDGVADIIEGRGHGYGLYWWKQTIHQSGQRCWMRYPIETLNSQYHDMKLVDIDNDGDPELITGKRYRAHSGKDPGANDPLGLYYFKINRGQFERVKLDYGGADSHSGAGIYFWVDDIDDDGFKDIVAPGKEGLYLFKHIP